MKSTCDFVVVGAGIIGLTLARELRRRMPGSSVLVLEKEPALGRHGSGRNSGVLHSGTYYAEGTLKASVCARGAQDLAAYCGEHRLPLRQVGKVIVPTREHDRGQLDLLLRRGRTNGVRAELIDERQLAELEPEARSATGTAVYVPGASVFDPHAVLRRLEEELRESGVEIAFRHGIEAVFPERNQLVAGGRRIDFGHLYNAAGLHADRIAHMCGSGHRFEILPFKGLYYDLAPGAGIEVRGLIYPVPDLDVPFLGVHFTRDIGGRTHVGPTAIPAFGRENYVRLEGVRIPEAGRILGRVIRHYVRNEQGFRRLAREEGMRLLKPFFVRAARALLPRLRSRHLVRGRKVGIRAQLADRVTGSLVMDFLVERGANSTHVLNAVSPGFTSAFAFARLVLDEGRRKAPP